MHESRAHDIWEPSGKTAFRRKAAEMHALELKSLRDTIDILEAENKALQEIERMRCAANDEHMRQKATAFETAASSIQVALDYSSISLEKRSLERRIDAQNKQLAELRSHLDSTLSAAKKDRSKHSKEIASLEASHALRIKKAEVVSNKEVEVLQAKLNAELLEKASLEEQLADERKGAQGILMNFGESQNETQWKRKLTHLKAEHRDIQQQRDYYKKLCLSLQGSKLSP